MHFVLTFQLGLSMVIGGLIACYLATIDRLAIGPNKVAIVAMVNTEKALSNATQECNIADNNITNDITLENLYSNDTSSSSNGIFENRKFDWNSDQQGLVLGSFFYGYLGTQILGGIIADRYNPVISYGIGIVGLTIVSLFTPLATNSIGLPGIVAIRILTRAVRTLKSHSQSLGIC